MATSIASHTFAMHNKMEVAQFPDKVLEAGRRIAREVSGHSFEFASTQTYRPVGSILLLLKIRHYRLL